jgi:hypothetical protein
MVKILVYGYARGLHSARQLEQACDDDLGFRILAGNQQPDFWTIAAFRRRHQAALAQLLVETVKLAAAAGLVRLRDVAVDGTKVQAAASKHRAMRDERMEAEEARLEAAIRDYLQQMHATDQAEDQAHGRRGRGWTVRDDFAHAERRLATIRAAKARREAEAAAPSCSVQDGTRTLRLVRRCGARLRWVSTDSMAAMGVRPPSMVRPRDVGGASRTVVGWQHGSVP